jgi:hypothetical protein
MKTNTQRVRELSMRPRLPKFHLGQLVREPYHGEIGAVDKIFADLEAAYDTGNIPNDWYEQQSKPPKTPKGGVWYGVPVRRG